VLAVEATAALEEKLGREENAQRAFDGWKTLRDDMHAK